MIPKIERPRKLIKIGTLEGAVWLKKAPRFRHQTQGKPRGDVTGPTWTDSPNSNRQWWWNFSYDPHSKWGSWWPLTFCTDLPVFRGFMKHVKRRFVGFVSSKTFLSLSIFLGVSHILGANHFFVGGLPIFWGSFFWGSRFWGSIWDRPILDGDFCWVPKFWSIFVGSPPNFRGLGFLGPHVFPP